MEPYTSYLRPLDRRARFRRKKHRSSRVNRETVKVTLFVASKGTSRLRTSTTLRTWGSTTSMPRSVYSRGSLTGPVSPYSGEPADRNLQPDTTITRMDFGDPP